VEIDDAVRHFGENVIVTGEVASVHFSKQGHAYLNFGANYPTKPSRSSFPPMR